MSHVQGAVVVRRQDLTQASGNLAPAHGLDFVKTLQSYFPTSRDSLLRCVAYFLKFFSSAAFVLPSLCAWHTTVKYVVLEQRLSLLV